MVEDLECARGVRRLAAACPMAPLPCLAPMNPPEHQAHPMRANQAVRRFLPHLRCGSPLWLWQHFLGDAGPRFCVRILSVATAGF